jgi:hypothetical protein
MGPGRAFIAILFLIQLKAMNNVFKSFWKAVLLTTLFAGIADLILAYTMQTIRTGQFPSKMLLYMAGGALGLERSMSGGFWTHAVGLLFHFFISFSFTILVFILFPLLKLQRFNKWWLAVFSFIYTIFVNLWMHYVVLPLTLLPPQKPLTLSGIWPGWFIFTLIFSFPIFLAASWYYRNRALIKSASARSEKSKGGLN